MKRKLLIIFFSVIVLVIAAYFYLRFSILNTHDFKPDTSDARSILDLRSQLIAKLQQVVKDGTDGLYNLSIKQIEPNVMQSRFIVIKAVLTPDSAALVRLENLEKAPDDVFKVLIDSFYIDGIGIGDLLSLKTINLDSVFLDSPSIEVHHYERIYNKEKRAENDSIPVYQKISRLFSSISINKIIIKNGTIVSHNLKEKTRIAKYTHVSVRMSNLLVDSSTQYDKSRFFYAKEADIFLPGYLTRTSDSLYFFKCSSVNISAVQNTLTAENIELLPRGNKQQFQKKLKGRQDMFTLKVPKLILSEIDWWNYVNSKRLIAKQADIYNCSFSDCGFSSSYFRLIL